MRRLLTFLFLFIAFIEISYNAKSQNQEVWNEVVLSSRVGGTIDSLIRNTYRLFPDVEHFVSAKIYQSSETGNFGIVVKKYNQNGSQYDSTAQIRRKEVEKMAETIENWEEIQKGSYVFGSKKVSVGQERTSVQAAESSRKKQTKSQTKSIDDYLPLAEKAPMLKRPVFETTGLFLGLSYSQMDFSEIARFTGAISNSSFRISPILQVPIFDQIYFLWLGANFDLKNSGVFSYFASVNYWIPGGSKNIRSFVGLGFARASFRSFTSKQVDISGEVWYSDVEISAGQFYPIVQCGIDIVPRSFGLSLIVPLAGKMETMFLYHTDQVARQYSVKLAATELGLYLRI